MVVGCTRVFWKAGLGAVGLWGFGLAGGPFAALGMFVVLVMPHEWA